MGRTMLLASALALVLSACAGSRGQVTDLTREPGDSDTHGLEAEPAIEGESTVEVVMTEFAFTPDTFTFEAGETVTFLFRNDGAVAHEALIGTAEEQEHHAAEMAGGETAHQGDLSAVDLQAGETRTLEYTFTGAGELIIGCHYAGHWDAGMRATIEVAG